MATEENGVAPFPLSAVDQEHLMTTDDDFRYHTWEDLKKIIGKSTHAIDVHAPVLREANV